MQTSTILSFIVRGHTPPYEMVLDYITNIIGKYTAATRDKSAFKNVLNNGLNMSQVKQMRSVRAANVMPAVVGCSLGLQITMLALSQPPGLRTRGQTGE